MRRVLRKCHDDDSAPESGDAEACRMRAASRDERRGEMDCGPDPESARPGPGGSDDSESGRQCGPDPESARPGPGGSDDSESGRQCGPDPESARPGPGGSDDSESGRQCDCETLRSFLVKTECGGVTSFCDTSKRWCSFLCLPITRWSIGPPTAQT